MIPPNYARKQHRSTWEWGATCCFPALSGGVRSLPAGPQGVPGPIVDRDNGNAIGRLLFPSNQW